jgi:hypothetical protein
VHGKNEEVQATCIVDPEPSMSAAASASATRIVRLSSLPPRPNQPASPPAHPAAARSSQNFHGENLHDREHSGRECPRWGVNDPNGSGFIIFTSGKT